MARHPWPLGILAPLLGIMVILFLCAPSLTPQPRSITVENVITDLADGTVLANLLEILTGEALS